LRVRFPPLAPLVSTILENSLTESEKFDMLENKLVKVSTILENSLTERFLPQ